MHGQKEEKQLNANITIGERLKDLRIERGLTLEHLEQETGISHSSLGKYESDDVKDISPFNLAKLAKYYGVSMNYLMRLTEQRHHPDMAVESLHINDGMIALLQSGRINNRLLCEMAQHEGFVRFMVDAEVFVDQIVAMHIVQMNDVLEYARSKVMESFDVSNDDLYMRTL